MDFDFKNAVEQALSEIAMRREYIKKLCDEGAFESVIEHQMDILGEQRLGRLRYNLDMTVRRGQLTEDERNEIIKKDRIMQKEMKRWHENRAIEHQG